MDMLTATVLLILSLPAGAATVSSRTALSPKEVFEERVAAWVSYRDGTHVRMLRLRTFLASQPGAEKDLVALWQSWRKEEALQTKLKMELAENQDRALKDSALSAEQHAVHKVKLERMLKERLLKLWGQTAPSELNAFLKKRGAVKVDGYPFKSYPSDADWNAYHIKDFVPVYEKGAMKTVKPE